MRIPARSARLLQIVTLSSTVAIVGAAPLAHRPVHRPVHRSAEREGGSAEREGGSAPRVGGMPRATPQEGGTGTPRSPSREITVQDLLLHTSGLSHRTSDFAVDPSRELVVTLMTQNLPANPDGLRQKFKAAVLQSILD
jgi:hypothetical protein